MIVRQVKKSHFYDIFLGSGWGNQTRVEKNNDYLKYVSGNRLNRYQIARALKLINDGAVHNPQPPFPNKLRLVKG